jgi:DNA-binding CsgD family transcriptional regulator/tetratricopeptide (TPR) repeat protein
LSVRKPVFCRRFIGRELEMTALLDLARSVHQDGGAVALISGEAGIGKSRFVAEWRARLPRGMKSYSGACLDFAPAPFGPVVDVFRAIAAERSLESSDQIASDDVRGLLTRDRADAVMKSDEELFLKRRLFRSLHTALREAASADPFVIVIEDMHWADTTTLDFFRFVTENVAELRALIVLVFRNDSSDADALDAVRAKLERMRSVHCFELANLAMSDMQSLISAAVPSSISLPAGAIRSIGERSEGNPLFAEELLKSVLEHGAESVLSILPISVTGALSQRIRNLDDGDRELLQAAALIGRTFDAGALAAINDVPELDVRRFLRRTIESNLIIEEPSKLGRFSFRHSLVREIVMSKALEMEARALHLDIATYLCNVFLDDTRDAEIAEHLWHGGDYARCGPRAAVAGDRWRAMHAYREAAEQYERAIACKPSDPIELASLYEKAGNVREISGSSPLAIAHYTAAIKLLQATGRTEDEVRVTFELGLSLRRSGQLPQAFASLEDAMQKAEAFPLLQHKIEVLLYELHAVSGNFADARKYLARVERIVDTLDSRDRIRFLIARSLTALEDKNLNAWRADCENGIDVAGHSGDPGLIVAMLNHYGMYASRIGEYPVALEAYARALDVGKGHALLNLTLTRLAFADTLVSAGRLGEARTHLEDALADDLSSLDVRLVIAHVGIVVGTLLEDDALRARCAPPKILETAFETGNPLLFVTLACAYADMLFAHGQPDRAAELLKRLFQNMRETVDAPDIYLTFAACGRDQDVVSARRMLVECSQGAFARTAIACLELFDAHVARRDGRKSTVDVKALAAARRFRALHLPLLEAEALELARRFGEARAICERAGVKRLPRARQPASGKTGSPLTRREREIADLMAKRLTNRAIAERLSLSERTVESHLLSIFRKLGVARREELHEVTGG